MNNKEYHNIGIKNYFLTSNDGQCKDKIDKKCKKMYRRIARKRIKTKRYVDEYNSPRQLSE